ncbi:hypothetical protein SLS59_000985 [Nothophoma quercina]|uniref:Transcriptional coactivator p15 (PC4) C-terminal domain-containing protein n=1 Tax=Nothophoma quercina TaxID=749835 RepID=A0ABR3RYG8_9PLEO
MAGGFKRGGFRGGGGGGLNKGYAKKRSPEDDDDAPRASKKSKGDEDEADTAPVVPRLQTDDDDNPFIALNHSGKRRMTVSDFKSTTLVSIREYWTNDAGELKPGKKGISLSIEQYNALLAAAPLLESILTQKNIQVARPDYEADLNAAETIDEKEEEQQPAAKVDDDEDDK